jgi:hypothetical protein
VSVAQVTLSSETESTANTTCGKVSLELMLKVTYVIVDVGIADSDPVAAMRDIKESVVVDLVRGQITRKINMIDPDVGSGIKANGIACIVEDIFNLQVAKNDVACAFHSESNAENHYRAGQFCAQTTGIDGLDS